jgi:hypothetical protein
MVNKSKNAVEGDVIDKVINDECASDEELLLQYVVCGEGELLYLDTYLTETFGMGLRD